MGIEELVAELGDGFSGRSVVVVKGGRAEEVSEHEETVRRAAGGVGFAQAVVGDGVGLHVAELWKVGTLAVEHPDDIAGNGFFEEGEG